MTEMIQMNIGIPWYWSDVTQVQVFFLANRFFLARFGIFAKINCDYLEVFECLKEKLLQFKLNFSF